MQLLGTIVNVKKMTNPYNTQNTSNIERYTDEYRIKRIFALFRSSTSTKGYVDLPNSSVRKWDVFVTILLQ